MKIFTPPFVGKTFKINYGMFTAINSYDDDGIHMSFQITEGSLAGLTGTISYKWEHVADDIYVISWQEDDRSTVVHVEDFTNGTSRSFFTTQSLDFYRVQGSISEISK